MESSRLKFYHWNLKGIVAHYFPQVPLIEAFIKANNIDIICLSETFLDSTIPLNDERLYIKGYSMIRADHPSNKKRRGVCIYYKGYLLLNRKIDVCKLNECIVTEIIVNNERYFLTCLTDLQVKIKSSLSRFAKTLQMCFQVLITSNQRVQFQLVIPMPKYGNSVQVIKITKLGKTKINLQQLCVIFK